MIVLSGTLAAGHNTMKGSDRGGGSCYVQGMDVMGVGGLVYWAERVYSPSLHNTVSSTPACIHIEFVLSTHPGW